jgi:hypothetical protein
MMIHLKITCKSSSDPAYPCTSGRSMEYEHAAREIVVFTRNLETAYTPQCGLHLTVDGVGFTVLGEADQQDNAITFRASVQQNYDDNRITYVRMWRKELYKRLLAGGWVKEVIKEAV